MNLADQRALKTAFGKHVRKIREKKGLSLGDVAANCELDGSCIGKIERGERTVELGTLLELAKGLEIDPCQLLKF